MIMWYSRAGALLGALALLSACGGGDVTVTPAEIGTGTPTQDVTGFNGIWEGSYNSNVGGQTCGDLRGLILNGQVRVVSEACNMVLVGSMSVSGDTASISVDTFAADGSGATGAASFSGSFTRGSVINGIYSNADGDSGNFVLNYNIIYENDSSLSKVEGSWEYKSASDWVDLRINNVGNIVGADNNGCSYAGNISLIDPAYNLYAYNIILENLNLDNFVFTCPTAGNYTGVASITAGANGSMTVLAGNDQNVFFADLGKASGTTN